ncbi:DUF262 domain-containing protein [Candidatus Deianiraea vastatrix]|uniref:DUF262 domain-containing protein n=1 Tax=Candidatus Deianiraea vastatrix TaxID=2163644 RepID=A0A5B8XCC1_9RICK|nr:DUF262 domain-containing protein [Candidatus Deianiraea vastatrix]QED22982.1 hypothetical protein Deia_00174 [Candidatus Deianiraea vastatrix]
MTNSQKTINDIFTSFKCFVIPLYQRHYNWEHEQCKTLFTDIQNDSKHFTGSIAIKLQSNQCYNVIDGQQRLTTATLLILAIRDVCNDVILREAIESKYLFTDDKSNKVTRLQGGDVNRVVIDRLIRSSKLDDNDKQTNAYKNYIFFKEKLKEKDTNINDIFNKLESLRFVVIELFDDQDEHKVFESLNATGVELRESDLIRNYIFIKIKGNMVTEVLTHWNEIEKCVNDNNGKELDKFFKHYLSYKFCSSFDELGNLASMKVYRLNRYKDEEISKPVSDLAIYDNFKYFYKDITNNNVKDIIFDIVNFARMYAVITNGTNDVNVAGYNAKVIEKIEYLSFLGQTTTYPLLFEILLQSKSESEQNILKSLSFLESYIFRSLIARDGALKSMGVNVIKILKDCKKNKKSIFQSIKDNLFQTFPLNKSVEDNFKSENFYKGIVQSKEIFYFFLRIDNANTSIKRNPNTWNKTINKETGYTIEHIFPQKEKWSNENEKLNWCEQDNYKFEEIYPIRNSIGNLIPSEQNYKVGDKPLKVKIEKYKEVNSHFKETSEFISKIEKNGYSLTLITERVNELLEIKFKKEWPDKDFFFDNQKV